MNCTLEPLNTKRSEDELKNWLQRFDALCIVNNYKTAYDILACATAPKLPRQFTVPELSEILLKQVANQRSVVGSRYEFYNRKQGVDESARELERALRTLANGCEFGEQLYERLRDQYICAIKDTRQL